MTHFTRYQRREYRRLFDDYAHHNKSEELGVYELYALLPQFGPELSIEQIKGLIYKFSSDGTGTLDFEDFLTLLGDYEPTVVEGTRRVMAAFQRLASASTNGDGIRRQDFERILTLGDVGLVQAELRSVMGDYFPRNKEWQTAASINTRGFLLAMDKADLAWVHPYNESSRAATHAREVWNSVSDESVDIHKVKAQLPLTADEGHTALQIRVYRATNLQNYERMKVRGSGSLEYATLDPIVVVMCAGKRVETTVMLGHTYPEWGQNLELPLTFPEEDAYSIQTWIEAQRVEFHLFDYVSSGVVPHMEWMGWGSIPLATALSHTDSPLNLVIALNSPCPVPEGATDIHLEVGIRAHGGSSIVNLFESHEDWWLRYYRLKAIKDLSDWGDRHARAAARAAGGHEDSTASLGGDNLVRTRSSAHRISFSFSRSKIFDVPLRIKGPRVILGDHVLRDDVVPLITVEGDDDSEDSDEASGLWGFYFHSYTELRKLFRRRNFQVLGLDEYNTFRFLCTFVTPIACPPGTTPELAAAHVAAIPTSHDTVPWRGPPVVADQCRSPSVAVFGGTASVLEHAILLCDLFLGLGMDAYVAVGQTMDEEPHYWVVTLEECDPEISSNAAPVLRRHFDLRRKMEESSNTRGVATSVSGLSLNSARSHTSQSSDEGAGVGVTTSASGLHLGVHSLSFSRAKPQDVHTLVSDMFIQRHNSSIRVQHSSKGGVKEPTDENLVFSNALFEHPRLDEVIDRQVFREGGPRPVRVVHWDPVTGFAYDEPMDAAFPFGRVGSVFNPHNIYVNTQASDVVGRMNWDLFKADDWHAFLADDVIAEYGPIECWYAPPSFQWEVHADSDEADSRALVERLVELIQLYRRHYLYIPNTQFHREACCYLQSDLTRHITEGIDEGFSFPVDTDAGVYSVLPGGHVWHSRMFRFTSPNADDIIEALTWTGILDVTVPQTAFAIAGLVCSQHWGLRSVYVHVGYMYAAEAALTPTTNYTGVKKITLPRTVRHSLSDTYIPQRTSFGTTSTLLSRSLSHVVRNRGGLARNVRNVSPGSLSASYNN